MIFFKIQTKAMVLIMAIALSSNAAEKSNTAQTYGFTLNDYLQSFTPDHQRWEKNAQIMLNTSKNGMYYILRNPSKINTVIEVAETLNNLYPNNVIVSLGQSPAYIVKTADFLSKFKNKSSNEYKYLAFSGRFLSKHEKGRQFFLPSYKGSIPTPEQLNKYENYLKLLLLNPASIVSQFQKNKQPIVFVEYIQSGESLASFIYTLMSIAAREGVDLTQLKAAIIIHSFQPLINHGWPEIKQISAPPYSIKINNTQIVDNDLMVGLANADQFNDRLVAHYSVDNWGKINPILFQPSQDANHILFSIIHQMVQKENQSQKAVEKKRQLGNKIELYS